MFSWFSKKQSDQTLDPEALRQTLETNVWQYRYLDAVGRDRVAGVVDRLVADKEWVGGSGFRVTSPMRATVAGVAALATIGLDKPFFFPRLKTIILYPKGFRTGGPNTSGLLTTLGGGVSDPMNEGGRLGEAWQGGPVVLSWANVRKTARSPARGHNLVLHELAHHLDGLDGSMDGQPHMPHKDAQRDWHAVTDAEYHRLVGQSRRGEATLLDTYGATSRAEFFAVAVECFFERPHELRERHAELYKLLSTFFHQSTADWLPDTRQQHPVPKCVRCRRRASTSEAATVDYSDLSLSESDRRFTHGVDLLDRGQTDEAITELSAVLEQTPDDAEALSFRAVARLQQEDNRGAMTDAESALAHDPDDMNALLVAADAGMALGEDREAMRRVRRALEIDKRSANGWLLLGLLQERSGQLRRARKSLRQATIHEPLDAETHYSLGRVCEALGDHRAAARAFDRVEHLEPGAEFDSP